MKILQRITIFFILVTLCISSLAPANSATLDEVKHKTDETANHLLSLDTPIVFSVYGEWMVTGLARGERISKTFAEGYYNNAVEFVKQNGSPKLDRSKSTENSRMIIALTSIGKDVTDVGGYNLLEPLADIAYVKKQGINGAVWALIALDTVKYDIPSLNNTANLTTREKLISYILSKQLPDGGWDRRNTESDPDITAMVITALSPYYNRDNDVKEATDKALEALSKLQKDNGGFLSYGEINAESCAQVITALSSLGIDCEKDNRFIKNGKSVIDALMSFSVEGGFSHSSNEYSQMSTEQGYYALTAYERLLQKKTSLFDMSDLITPKNGLGDINGDGTINIIDCTEIQKYIVKINKFSEHQCLIADFNRDKTLSVLDITEIQRFIVKQ